MEKLKWVKLILSFLPLLWKWAPMVWKWGFKGWKLGKAIYDDVEERRHPDGATLSSDESARDFNRDAEQEIPGKTRKAFTRPQLNELREDVWKYKNRGKIPKRLNNARYRATPTRRGKTARKKA